MIFQKVEINSPMRFMAVGHVQRRQWSVCTFTKGAFVWKILLKLSKSPNPLKNLTMHYQACFWYKANKSFLYKWTREKNKNFSKYRATYLSSNLHIHSIVNDCFHKYSRYTSLDINEKIFLQWKQKILFQNG